MSLSRSLVRRPVAIIALAQLFGTSLWFSANSAADDLMIAWDASASDIGLLTSAVQVGFILGTLTLAFSGIADRFKASRIFLACAVAGAAFNGAFALLATGLTTGTGLRFLVGLSLAGIYPIGMKLIVSWAPQRAGHALAMLVGMLTLGTALPHALRVAGAKFEWQSVILASSILALVAALLIFKLGDGPHIKPRPAKVEGIPEPHVLTAFKSPDFRAAALGYFGHMWELYAFWTLVPMLVVGAGFDTYRTLGGVSGTSFAVIAIGAVACIAGGIASQHIGSAKVAAIALLTSGLCCVLCALFGETLPPTWLLILLLVWGAAVIADSPQFSALSVRFCPPHLVASALAIQNAIGFSISIVSISLGTRLVESLGLHVSWVLLPGPVLGLIAFWPLVNKSARKI